MPLLCNACRRSCSFAGTGALTPNLPDGLVQTGFETPTAVTKIVPKTRCSVRFSYLFASSPLCQRRVDPRHTQSYAVSTCSRTQIQGLAVVLSRCKVVGMFGANNRPQMLALWRDDPKSARPGYVQVSLLIELHAESV